MAEKRLEAHLYEELKRNNTKRALYIVELLGDDVDRFYGGKTLLVWAKKFANKKVIEALEQKGAKEIISEEEKLRLRKELSDVIRSGDVNKLDDLINEGVDVNVRDFYDSDTILITACKVGNLDIVKKLVENGADINNTILCNSGEVHSTPATIATKYGHIEITEYLLNAGADIKECGHILLNEASRLGVLDLVKKMVDSGVDVNKKAMDEVNIVTASRKGYLDVVEYLILNGANLNKKNADGETALISAFRWKHFDILNMLIEKGADVNQQDNRGETVLMMASQTGHLEMIGKLIENGADVNIKSAFGGTAMSLAKDEETRRAILEAVKKKNEKAKENEPSFMDRVKGLFGKGE